LTEDLDRDPGEIPGAVEEIDDGFCRVFVERRAASPAGQEYIQGIAGLAQGCSLHVGEDRGLTWHDRENHAVWLLAARFHRSGQADDAYPYFRQLAASVRLLPDALDYEYLFELQEYTFGEALLSEPSTLVAEARANRGHEVRGRIGGTVEVAVVVEDLDGSEVQYVAISLRLLEDGDVVPPHEWIPLLLAAFFDWLHDPAAELITEQALPNRPREPDELVFAAIR
jgi:hypothetical protein